MLLLLTVQSVSAQQRWSIGPRVGANISNQMGDIANTIDVKWLPGWSVGGFIMYSDINHFGISADVLYSQKGAEFEGVANGSNYSFKQRINYLEIPVLARYFLTLSGSFRPNFFIGPSVAFKLNAKQKDFVGNNRTQADVDNGDLFRPADLGLTGGIALNFEVAKGKRVLFDARYTYGLADVTLAAGSIRNSAVTLNLSYGFGIGKKYGR
ncbi:MAG TPA: porin family protein [Cytophagales bacterium]